MATRVGNVHFGAGRWHLHKEGAEGKWRMLPLRIGSLDLTQDFDKVKHKMPDGYLDND